MINRPPQDQESQDKIIRYRFPGGFASIRFRFLGPPHGLEVLPYHQQVPQDGHPARGIGHLLTSIDSDSDIPGMVGGGFLSASRHKNEDPPQKKQVVDLCGNPGIVATPSNNNQVVDLLWKSWDCCFSFPLKHRGKTTKHADKSP